VTRARDFYLTLFEEFPAMIWRAGTDGQSRWVLSVGRPFSGLEGEFAGFIGSCYDIIERKMQEEELSYLAMHDPLTGMSNRRMLEVVLPRLIEQTELGRFSALFFIDLDNFKLVNDNFGHNVGDELLIGTDSQKTAQRRGFTGQVGWRRICHPS
jgi:predicted signal transduction protein with EAL and GGDEF domain